MKPRKKQSSAKKAEPFSEEVQLLRQQNQRLVEINTGYVNTITRLLETIDKLTLRNLALSYANDESGSETHNRTSPNHISGFRNDSGSFTNDNISFPNEKNSFTNDSVGLRNDNIGFINDNNSSANDINSITNESNGNTNENNAIRNDNNSVPNDNNTAQNSIATPEETIESFTKRWRSVAAKANRNTKYTRKDVIASQAKFFFSIRTIRQGTSSELFAAAGVKPTSGMRYIAILKELGFIEFVGPRSNGFYRLTPSALDFVSGKTNKSLV
jgi:molecular chaperone GrpE (heat shock protein)